MDMSIDKDIQIAYENLAIAIIESAVKDYKKALKGTTDRDKYTVRKCEEFFRSGYYQMLTNVSGELIIKKANSQKVKFEKRKNYMEEY